MNPPGQPESRTLIQLTYLSAARPLFSARDILDILEVSRRNNARDNITGILVYKSGSVLQTLEGEDLPVRRLFEVIRLDPRHHNVNLLFVWPIPQRRFPDWTMAFKRFGEPGDLQPEGFSELLEPGFDMSKAGSERTQAMLKNFIAHVR